MPVYVYRCQECGVQFERFQKFSDQPLVRCPECNKKALHKVYTPVGIVFKGSGFYATDNRSPSGTNRHTNETKSEGKSQPASESKKTTTDASQSETKSEGSRKE